MAAVVKICGLGDAGTVQAVAGLPVDYIGFVFAPSRRRVTAQQAAELIAALPSESLRPLTAGVFVDPSREELAAVLNETRLDVVQLHGQETPELCRWVKETYGVEVFKVISVVAGMEHEAIAQSLNAFAGAVDVILLDTQDPVYGGGSGKTFAWDCIPGYRDAAHRSGMKLLVAGGLTPDNVAELIERYAPDGVDVSSGVETDGRKDLHKIQTFVGKVKPQ